MGIPRRRSSATQTFLRIGPGNAELIAINDDSMAPNIRTGGYCIADASKTDIVDGEVYLVRIGDRRLVRRIHREYGGRLRLTADAGGLRWGDELVCLNEVKVARDMLITKKPARLAT